MYLKASSSGFEASPREYFEWTYWSLETSRTSDTAAKWRMTFAVDSFSKLCCRLWI
jgi:hypothetical protein